MLTSPIRADTNVSFVGYLPCAIFRTLPWTDSKHAVHFKAVGGEPWRVVLLHGWTPALPSRVNEGEMLYTGRD